MGTGLSATVPVEWDIAALFGDAHLFTAVRRQPPFLLHYDYTVKLPIIDIRKRVFIV